MNIRKTIGVLVDWPEKSSTYQYEILRGIRSCCQGKDYNVHVLSAGRLNGPFRYESRKNRIIDFINKDVFDGIIVLSSSLGSLINDSTLKETLSQFSEIPVVSIGLKMDEFPSLLVDNYSGFAQLLRHLFHDHGYRKVAYVGGSSDNPDAISRKEIVWEIAKEAGLTIADSHFYQGNFLIDSGRSAVVEFLDKKQLDLEVIICANDDMAAGVWAELRERNIAIPEKIAVTGFDSKSIGKYIDLSITTVEQPLFEQGYRSAQILSDFFEGTMENKKSFVEMIPCKMVLRESCGCNTLFEGLNTSLMDKKSWSFLAEKKDEFKKVIYQAVDLQKPSLLTLEWKQILLECFEKSIAERDILLLAENLKEIVPQIHENSLKEDIIKNLYQLPYQTLQTYVQHEIMKDLTKVSIDHWVIGYLDGIFQSTVMEGSFMDKNGFIEKLLDVTNGHFLFISRFLGDSSPNGQAEVLYCNHDKDSPEKKIDNTYANRFIVHPDYLPQDRYEIVSALMFDEFEYLGFITLNTGLRGLNIYEKIRAQFSSILYSLKLTKQLKDEIEEREKVEDKLKISLEKVQSLSIRDELTGLYNRRGFLTLSEQALKQCLREKQSSMICFIDMDGLKKINDTFGHREGDKAIKSLSMILKSCFREADIIARLGGDEFAIFLANTNEEHLHLYRERLDKILRSENIKPQNPVKIAMSLGSCTYDSRVNNSVEKMLKTADAVMYEEKKRRKKTTSSGSSQIPKHH